MSRQLFGIEKGLRQYEENSDNSVDIIVGSLAPDGLGDQAAAAIGSLYQRIGVGELYIKTANAGAAGDWTLFSTGSTVTRWRPERVGAITNDTQGAGTRDMVVSPFADDDGTTLVPGDFVVGEFVISDADGTPILLEVTNVAGDDVTFAAAGTALVDGDAFICKFYLPDADGQENKALAVYSSGVMVKIADVDWDFATGINLSSGYSAVNGTVTNADTVESAIEKLDGNQLDLTTLSGVSQGSTDLGVFSGSTIPDNQTNKQALQSLETAHEEVDQNVDDLITLSGVAENSTDHGLMDQGEVLSDNATTNALFKETDAELTRLKGRDWLANITSSWSPVSSVLTDDVASCQWNITVEETGTPANKQHFSVFAGHNGSSDGTIDATLTDENKTKILKQGASFNVQVRTALVGVGSSRNATSI